MRFRYQHNTQCLYSRTLLKSLTLCFFLSITTFVNAKAITGELELKYWSNTEETIDIPVMRVRYNFERFIGEPLEQFNFYYETPNQYTEVVSAKFRAQVSVGGIKQDAYIKINPLVDSPGKWGWDIAGSPEWEDMFQTKRAQPISAEIAKSYFKNNFSLVNLEVLDIEVLSGVNDQEYEDFLSLIPTSYTKRIGSKGLLDGKIPSKDREYSNFWNNRKIAEYSNWRAPVNENDRSEIVRTQSFNHLNWMYGQYQHAYVELEFHHLSGKSEESQEVIIDFFWEDYDTGRTRKKSYRRTVKKGQMALVAAERVHRPKRKDGSLSVYSISYTIRYTKEEDTSEEKAVAKNRLDNAYESNQLRLFTIANHQQNSYADKLKKDIAYDKTPEGKHKLELKRLAKLAKERKIKQDKENRIKQEAESLAEEKRLLAEHQRFLEQQELERLKRQREHEKLLAKQALDKEKAERRKSEKIRKNNIRKSIAKEKKREADKARHWAERRAKAKKLNSEKQAKYDAWFNNQTDNTWYDNQAGQQQYPTYYSSDYPSEDGGSSSSPENFEDLCAKNTGRGACTKPK